MKYKYHLQKGVITPALLVISASMITVLFGVLIMLAIQLDYSHRQVASEEALNIADAGINYYKWHLAHNPNDYKDGTDHNGPYTHNVLDPQGTTLGQYSLEITPPTRGSTVITIHSTGWTNQYPGIKRTIEAKYGIQSMAQYSFLSNASSWYGAGVIVNGRIHSNNGIRMDGTNTSIVSSANATYQCGWETGCEPPTKKPGVWGSGGDQSLWQFPIPQVDFDSISLDLATLQEQAKTDGLLLETSGASGYHIIFMDNGTFRVNKVTKTESIQGYSIPGQGAGGEGLGGCRSLNQIITQESLIGSYNISDNPVVFLEDNLWVEGQIKGRVTIAAAKFPIVSSDINIWIPNSLLYKSYDGTNSLALISQNNIYFTRDIPNTFQVDAILMAQRGTILRHGYLSFCGGTTGAVKQKLTTNGSLISYYKSYWNYGSGPESGFIERELNFDSDQIFNPPPYFPTSGDFQIISWTEE